MAKFHLFHMLFNIYMKPLSHMKSLSHITQGYEQIILSTQMTPHCTGRNDGHAKPVSGISRKFDWMPIIYWNWILGTQKLLFTAGLFLQADGVQHMLDENALHLEDHICALGVVIDPDLSKTHKWDLWHMVGIISLIWWFDLPTQKHSICGCRQAFRQHPETN